MLFRSGSYVDAEKVRSDFQDTSSWEDIVDKVNVLDVPTYESLINRNKEKVRSHSGDEDLTVVGNC